MSDFTMITPVIQLLKLIRRHARSPPYLYRYNHRSSHTDPPWWGCYHSLELDSVFGSPFTLYDIARDTYEPFTHDDKRISRVVMDFWTRFVKHG